MRELEPQAILCDQERAGMGMGNAGQNWAVVANSARSTIRNYHFTGSGGEFNVVSVIQFCTVRTVCHAV